MANILILCAYQHTSHFLKACKPSKHKTWGSLIEIQHISTATEILQPKYSKPFLITLYLLRKEKGRGLTCFFSPPLKDSIKTNQTIKAGRHSFKRNLEPNIPRGETGAEMYRRVWPRLPICTHTEAATRAREDSKQQQVVSPAGRTHAGGPGGGIASQRAGGARLKRSQELAPLRSRKAGGREVGHEESGSYWPARLRSIALPRGQTQSRQTQAGFNNPSLSEDRQTEIHKHMYFQITPQSGLTVLNKWELHEKYIQALNN